MQLISRLPKLSIIAALLSASLFTWSQCSAASQSADIPIWLKAHVGEREGHIPEIVLRRARALYLRKVTTGSVTNPCYFAMDATQPNDLGEGKAGRRFYVICEPNREFRAISAGHGSGRYLEGVADFSNGRACAKNFGNGVDSKLTTGGGYVTAETKTSFKGYYRTSAYQDAALTRTFVQFEGEGDTANAREREIGGHAAVLLRGVCRRKVSNSPYADPQGYVAFGALENYDGGRSNGCTTWSPSEAGRIISIVKENPTTLYIYPAASDVEAVARAIDAGRKPSSAGLYWNTSCLTEIGRPKFWSAKSLTPVLVEYKNAHPLGPERPIPICKGD
jgi:hypothetical protein